MLTITILGCGSSGGVPLVGGLDGSGEWGTCNPDDPRNRRTRASIIVDDGQTRVLIDTSPDLRQQLLANNIKEIDAILYTHDHADHLHGIDDIRSLNFHKNAALPMYGAKEHMDVVKERFPYVFTPLKPNSGFYKPSGEIHLIDPPQPFLVGTMTIQPFWQDHGFVRSLGFRINDFVYSTDVKAFPGESTQYLENMDLWVVDCLQPEPHPTHANHPVTFDWIKKYKPRRAVLTHLNHRSDYKTLQKMTPDHIDPAYDGMQVISPITVAGESQPTVLV